MKTIYIALIIALFWTGCSEEQLDRQVIKEGEPIRVSFAVDIPDEILSRAVDETTISSLWLLLFDESGNYITRAQATFTGTTFTATLPQSTYRRIVHFVANHNWTGFSDSNMAGKNEGEVVAPLASTDLVFWQRVVLPSGVYSGAFASTTVSLLRNMAKVTLVNNATSKFTNAQFTLYNKLTAGTVAPFNTSSWTFGGTISEPAGVGVSPASDPYGTAPLYCFERKNSKAGSNRTFAIVKGTYSGATYYYKIDLINSANTLYDLTRNTLYEISINSVSGKGYADETSAKNGPASNNIWASVELVSYTTVDNGTYALSVSPLSASFTTNNQAFSATARYYRLSDNTTFNSSVAITLTQDASAPVVNGTVSYNTSTGALTANIYNPPADGTTRTAMILVSAGGLARTITLVLGQPFRFADVGFSPSVISGAIGTSTTLNFTIPAEAAALLPLACNISTNYLYPVTNTNITVSQSNGQYTYSWLANSTGVQYIDFKTSVVNASEAVLINAVQFATASAIYTNTASSYRFSNISITPLFVSFGTGQAVTLNFSVPTAGTFQIYTNNLNPVTGSISGGIYTYTATTAGLQTVNFTTNKAYVTETITLKGTNYVNAQTQLQNVLIQVSGKLTYSSNKRNIATDYVTLYVNGQVAGIILTDASGNYTTTLKAKLGDILSYTYGEYTATATLSAAVMTINANLLR